MGGRTDVSKTGGEHESRVILILSLPNDRIRYSATFSGSKELKGIRGQNEKRLEGEDLAGNW